MADESPSVDTPDDEPRDVRRGGPWRGRPPRHRPPWWPENEPWPPRGRAGRAGGWHARPRGWWRAVGCLVTVVVVLSVVGAFSLVVSVLGLVLAPIEPLSRPLGVLLLLGLVIATVTLVRGLRRLSDPLSALVEAARRVEQGDYEARVAEAVRGPRELRELVRAFNTMASRLEADRRQRRTLLAEVSHELRTPLAVLRGNLEAIADGVHVADAANVAALIEETQVMERLVEDLRTLTLAEADALPLHPEPVDVDALVGEAVASFQSAAAAGSVTLRVSAPTDLPLLDADPVRLREVLTNLVANALRHTPPGGTVEVRARTVDAATAIEIVVEDTGSGIDPALLPRVFERFARGRGSRGSGLGLTIARDLVRAHGGTIAVESELGRGTTFRVLLPTDRAGATGARTREDPPSVD